MKRLLFLLLPLLLLCACGEAPTVRETVCDVVEAEVAAPEAYTILLAIPKDTELLPRSPARTETVYAQTEGLYEIDRSAMFPFGDLADISERLKLNVFTNTPVVSLDPATRTVTAASAR